MPRTKKKTLLSVLFTPFLWLLNSCGMIGEPVDTVKSENHYYNLMKTDIQYIPHGNYFTAGRPSLNADIESFQVLNGDLSKDKNNIYYEAYAVVDPIFDIDSLYVRDEENMHSLAFDETSVYSFSKENLNENTLDFTTIGLVQKIEGADPLTFRRTDESWAIDGKSHFYENTRIDSDYDSFEKINLNFSKDSSKTFVRIEDKFIPFRGDAKTLTGLDDDKNAKDNANLYVVNIFKNPSLHVIPYADFSKVKLLGEFFIQVEDAVYFDGKAIKGADLRTFEVVGFQYSKDANHVYYATEILENADVASFRLESGFRDKNGEYEYGRLLK